MMETIKRYLRPEQIRELSLVFLIIVTLIFFGTQIEWLLQRAHSSTASPPPWRLSRSSPSERRWLFSRAITTRRSADCGLHGLFSVGTQLANNNEIAPLAAVLMAIGLGADAGPD